MKKNFVIFAFLAFLFFVTACSDEDEEKTETNQTKQCSYNDYKCENGNSYWCGHSGWNLYQPCTGECDSETGKCKKNQEDKETDDSGSDINETPDDNGTGELGGRCYPNKTCNDGLVCDIDNNICMKDPGNSEDNDLDPDDKEDADNTEITDNDDVTEEPDDTDPDGDAVSDSDDDIDASTPDENSEVDKDPEADEDSENQDEDADSGEDDPVTLGKICTGQTSCYNASASITCPASPDAAFYGQDAQYSGRCTPKSLTVETISGDNVVVDGNTGLMWQQTFPANQTYTWANAKTSCSGLTYAGQTGWRLPTPQEILTIVDNSKYGIALDKTLFPNMPASSTAYLWTSKAQGTTSNAFAFNPYRGSTYYESKTAEHHVMCVYGEELPEGSFATLPAESEEKVVVDSTTGLMWQKNYDSGTYNWQAALKHCEDLQYAGYDDWRLPDKNELASLLNLDKSAAPYSNFPDMPKNRFWSSSTRVDSKPENAWVIMFAEGYVSGVEKTVSYSVRCVR